MKYSGQNERTEMLTTQQVSKLLNDIASEVYNAKAMPVVEDPPDQDMTRIWIKEGVRLEVTGQALTTYDL